MANKSQLKIVRLIDKLCREVMNETRRYNKSGKRKGKCFGKVFRNRELVFAQLRGENID